MRRTLLALVALAAIICVAPQVARAQTEPANAATLRIIHAVAGGPPVDVYIDGQKAAISLDFFAESTFGLTRNDHEVRVVREGDSPSQALVGKRFYSDREDVFTLALIGDGNDVTGLMLQDRNDSPEPDEARVRFIHAAQDLGPLDVALAGQDPFFRDAVFGSATYIDVPVGTYAFDLSSARDDAELLRTLQLQFLPGWTYTLVITGSEPENLWVQAIVDRPAR